MKTSLSQQYSIRRLVDHKDSVQAKIKPNQIICYAAVLLWSLKSTVAAFVFLVNSSTTSGAAPQS